MSDTHIYMDLDMINNDQESNGPPPVLKFEETRNSPFLPGDSSDYYLSILRFSVQTGSELPVFIPRIETGPTQMDINKTVYRVTVEHNGIISTFPVIWRCLDETAEQPSPPMLNQDIKTRYYYMNNFSQFVPMLNQALSEAWQITVIPGAIPTDNAPFIDFDPDSNKFNLNVDIDVINSGTNIYFNTRLYELLSSFPADFIGYIGDTNYKLNFYNNRNVNVRQIYKASVSGRCNVVAYQALTIHQEISTVALWSPVSSIVFTSSLLPIKATNTSTPKIFNSGSTVNESFSRSSGSPNLANIITDFELAITDNNQYRPSINFNIGSEYRLVDLHKMNDLNRIDVVVYWKSIYGDLVPLRLQPGCTAHLKILFRHRNFNG